MFTLTDLAREELDAYFEDKERGSIRIYLAPGGCSGPRLALALDAPRDDDSVFEEKGHAFCVNKTLLAEAGDMTVDFTDAGFFVHSGLRSGGGCSPSACSACSSCGGGCSPADA